MLLLTNEMEDRVPLVLRTGDARSQGTDVHGIELVLPICYNHNSSKVNGGSILG